MSDWFGLSQLTSNSCRWRGGQAALVPVYRQLRYLSFGPQSRTLKIPAGLGVCTPDYRWKKPIRVSYSHRAPKNAAAILQLGSHLTLSRRHCLCLLLPSTSWGSLLLHIVGGGYHGRGGWLNGGRRILLLSLSSY